VSEKEVPHGYRRADGATWNARAKVWIPDPYGNCGCEGGLTCDRCIAKQTAELRALCKELAEALDNQDYVNGCDSVGLRHNAPCGDCRPCRARKALTRARELAVVE
jgi:hypothetical protein